MRWTMLWLFVEVVVWQMWMRMRDVVGMVGRREGVKWRRTRKAAQGSHSLSRYKAVEGKMPNPIRFIEVKDFNYFTR
jgi:hypothetical protein